MYGNKSLSQILDLDDAYDSKPLPCLSSSYNPGTSTRGLSSLGKLQLKTKVVGVDDLKKEQRNLETFLSTYSNNTTIAVQQKTRNH